MRHQAREIALQILFQHEFGVNALDPDVTQNILSLYEAQVPAEAREHAQELVRGVLSAQKEIDRLIQGKAAHWTLARMALVDRNVLRLCVYEMHFSAEKLNPRIAINEGVELAKKYGTTDSGGFVNGILDSLQTVSS